MKDANGILIEVGQTLKRIIAAPAVHIGQSYTVVSEKWDVTDDAKSLVADGDYIRHLLTLERAKEFEVAESPE